MLDTSLSVPGQVTAVHFSHIIRFINFICHMHLQFWTFLCHLPLQVLSYLPPAGRSTDTQHNWREENYLLRLNISKILLKSWFCSLGEGELVPVLFSLTCSSIKGLSPRLMTSDTLEEKSDSEQSKCRSDIRDSMRRPEMLSSLQDESPLMVVVVNVLCLQTDGAFKDQGGM